MSLSPDRGLTRADKRRIARGFAYPVTCRRCGLITGLSTVAGCATLCHACNWAEAFEEKATVEPRFGARPIQKLRDYAEVLTEGTSILPASSDRSLPGGVQAPSVSTSNEWEEL